MSAPIFNYPLDLTGISPTNLVVGELYTIGLVRGRMFATRGGPFYGNATILFDQTTGRELVPREDYLLLHYYEEASDRTDQPVYCAVSIINPEVGVNIGLTTQYVGGEFSFSYQAIKDAILALDNDNRPVQWGDLLGAPSEFNPANHLHDIRNSYGWESVVFAISRLEDAILKGSTTSINLLVDTVESKLRAIDLWRDQSDVLIANLRRDLEQGFIDYDLTVVQYLANFRASLGEYLKPLIIKTTNYTLSLNKTYDLFPPNVNTMDWTTNLTLSSALVPVDGDYIEVRAVRDGCSVVLNALNAPVKHVVNLQGVRTMVEQTNLPAMTLDRHGFRLVWDSRNGLWNMIKAVDPEVVTIDHYHMVEQHTTGVVDLSKANHFVLTAGANRTVTLLNTPTTRSTTVVITIMGNGIVFWPTIKWANGVVPSLSNDRTLITLHRANGAWVGSWTKV